ncbi:TIGR02594 family protein [Rugamonas sp. DEMB1]|uniref:TIGR02594 family protein n=1 Tax=Rugamonas sp. DEMB1 TaxID=3039386 RepID=UPI0024485806|nr:TIGR02594 family protein [Rugamonas sp. DEMB1]WGG53490.1 TIGR02594 family protein [Rugamonas sp. DEMB1]
MTAAFGERGIRRSPAGQTNPRIVEYNYHTNLRGYDDKISWCSSFMNWCLAQVGIAGTGSALARSWLEWGIPLESPVPGCIAVLTRDDPNSWKGHVGFFLRIEGDSVVLFGGNQLEEVREHYYPVTSILSYRWPDSNAEAGAGIGSLPQPYFNGDPAR